MAALLDGLRRLSLLLAAVGCLTCMANPTVSSALTKDAQDLIDTGVWQAQLTDAAEYDVTITWTFTVRSPGNGKVFLPLPRGPVLDDCVFQWQPSVPNLWAEDESGNRLPYRIVPPSRHFVRDQQADSLIDGAIYGLDFSDNTSLGALTRIRVKATFLDTIWAKADTVSPEGPVVGGLVDFPASKSWVDWENDTIEVFRRDLWHRATDYAHNSSSPNSALTLQGYVHWVRDSATYDASRGAPRIASQVFKARRGGCVGLANLGQALLARMRVESRAVCGVIPAFSGFGKQMSECGHSLHVLVEYDKPCGWGIFDPQLSDNVAIPMVRLACAREAHCLSAWSTGDIDSEPSGTEYCAHLTKHPILVAPGRRVREIRPSGGVRLDPYFGRDLFYRQIEAPLPCNQQCGRLWRAAH